jgi:hypothetical protein
MKTLLTLVSTALLTTQALAADPVTKIAGFQCHPRGSEANYMVWTEQAGDKQIVTVGTLGQTGVESIEKFISDRIHLDDIVTFTSKDETLKVAISNDYDGEFFAGDMVFVRNNVEVIQELACEEYVIKAD